MNLVHMKYAVEVAETGSINKAAEKLYIGQPNLSRAIKELEASLGVAVFDRSAKGMLLTPEGEIFINYAKAILKQVDSLENMFTGLSANKKKFSISVPRAGYISKAFSSFASAAGNNGDIEFFYKETNSMRAIKNILQEDYKLGIIRYSENFDKYYKAMLDEKGFNYEITAEFSEVVLINKNHPLASKDRITFDDLRNFTEIAHADPFVPSLPFSEVKKEELSDIKRRIFVFERASALELLAENDDMFMLASPIPPSTAEKYGLITKECSDHKKIYRDMLIYRKNYSLSELDKMFISELCKSKREIFK